MVDPSTLDEKSRAELAKTEAEFEMKYNMQLLENNKEKTHYDFRIYRWTLFFLGGAALAVIFLSFGMLFMGKETSEGLIAIASAAIGAMAGLLAPSTQQSKGSEKSNG